MNDFDVQYKKIMATLVAASANMDKQFAKFNESLVKSSEKFDADLAKSSEKFDADLAKSSEKFDADLAKSREEFDDRHRKLQESMDRANERLGGYTNNEAERLENEFYEGLLETMDVNGVRLDELRQRQKAKYEYDLVGINGKAVFVGEIKQKLLLKDVEKFAKERLVYFAEDFPNVAKRRKVFGMVGGGNYRWGGACGGKIRAVCVAFKKQKIDYRKHCQSLSD
ncbi:MAG: hypothetical protein ACNYPH_03260 [Gammaproteobacteria bacterium WSBS_2016_MAG_OTU1]